MDTKIPIPFLLIPIPMTPLVLAIGFLYGFGASYSLPILNSKIFVLRTIPFSEAFDPPKAAIAWDPSSDL